MIDEVENNLILEERGVAANLYNSAINDIYTYTENYLKNEIKNNPSSSLQEGSIIMVNIPQELSSRIDFIDENDFSIIVKVDIHNKENEIIGGYGDVSFLKYLTQINKEGQLNNGLITVNTIANTNGDIYKETFFSVFYHELNHAYEFYSQINHAPSNIGIETKFIQTDMARIVSNENFENDIKSAMENCYNLTNLPNYIAYNIRNLVYKLFSDAELNAFTAEMYGDLKGINSKRENYKNDIEKTETYHIYKHLKMFINDMKYLTDKAIIKLIYVFDKYHINYFGKEPSIFKQKFINYSNERLNIFFKKMMRSASLWYDNSEDQQRIAEYYTHPQGNNLPINQLLEYSTANHIKDTIIAENNKKIYNDKKNNLLRLSGLLK